MYTIYADDQLLYSPDLANDGYAVINPKLTEELNKTGSLEFTLPTNNVMYDKLQKLKTIVVVKLDGSEIWRGRVLHDEKDWYNRKQVYCEGMLSYLLDSIVRPYDLKGTIANVFGQLMIEHNKMVDSSKSFGWSCNVTDKNDYIHYSSTTYPNTFSEVIEKFVNRYGGYLKAWYYYGNKISYTTEAGGVSDQVIQFGENLLDITEYIDATNVFTVLIPLGKREETEDGDGNRLTIESVNDGKDYIEDETAISLFGRIERTQIWDDVTVASNLLSKGKSALEAGIEMAVTLSIKAVDLHLVDVKTSRIKLGDFVRVVSEAHGLDKFFLCSKVITDMVNPDKSEFTFGVTFHAMTDKQIEQQKKVQNTYNIVENASNQITNVNVNVSENYVSKSDFASYQSQVNSNFTTIKNSLTAVYHYKGTVTSFESLPTVGLTVGDTYNIEDTGSNYSWTGTEWDKLSETIDLSVYQTKEESDAVYATKEELKNASLGGESESVDLTGYAKKTDIPTELKNPNKLILTGAVEAEYDGSEEINIEIPAGDSDWTLLTSGELDLSTRQVGFHLSEYNAKEFIFIAKVPKTTTATTIYIQSGTGNIFSRQNNNYAFNIVGHMHLVNGVLCGLVGAIDGWAYNIPTAVVMNTPRTTSTSDADCFKLYNGTILESGNVVTYELWGR